MKYLKFIFVISLLTILGVLVYFQFDSNQKIVNYLGSLDNKLTSINGALEDANSTKEYTSDNVDAVVGDESTLPETGSYTCKFWYYATSDEMSHGAPRSKYRSETCSGNRSEDPTAFYASFRTVNQGGGYCVANVTLKKCTGGSVKTCSTYTRTGSCIAIPKG